VHNAFAVSADTVHTNTVTAVAFQEYIDVHILGVNTREHIEDTALGREDRCRAAVLGQNRGQLLSGNIVHIQPHRHYLPEISQLHRHILKILDLRLAFENHFLQVALLLFQYPLFYTAAFNGGSVQLVIGCFIPMYRTGHMADDRRLSF